MMREQDTSSAPKPAKRPRKATKARRKRSKPRPFPLFQLPTELVSYILDLITEPDELEALSWSCRTFYRACRRRALLARFPVDDDWNRNVFYFEGARKGEFGWKPFSIIHCSKQDEGEDILIYAAEHDVTRIEDGDTLAHLKIQWTVDDVYLREECTCDVCWSNPVTKVLSWRKQVRGRMVRMTASAMRERFVCPECMDTRSVMLGSEDLESRWPDLEAYRFPALQAPCPRCTTTYAEIAVIHHHATHLFEDLMGDEEAFNSYFAVRSPSPSPPPYPNLDFPDAPSPSTDGNSPCSSVSSSDENECPPPQTYHGETDADLDQLDFPSSAHSDLSDAESTEYASLQDDNLADNSSEDELEHTTDMEPSIDFEAEQQEAKRAKELERQEFEKRGWGELSGEPREYAESEEMDWEERWVEEQPEMELPEMDRRPEGPLWFEGYAYDYGNGWLWEPPQMQAYSPTPRYGGWGRRAQEDERSFGWSGGDARAARADWY